MNHKLSRKYVNSWGSVLSMHSYYAKYEHESPTLSFMHTLGDDYKVYCNALMHSWRKYNYIVILFIAHYTKSSYIKLNIYESRPLFQKDAEKWNGSGIAHILRGEIIYVPSIFLEIL